MGNTDHRDEATFQAFVSWARTMPADQTYDYCDTSECAYAQFLIATGRAKTPEVSPHGWWEGNKEVGSIDGRLDGSINDHQAPLRAGTFGGILEQLVALEHIAQ